jgi:hypothetical protein
MQENRCLGQLRHQRPPAEQLAAVSGSGKPSSWQSRRRLRRARAVRRTRSLVGSRSRRSSHSTRSARTRHHRPRTGCSEASPARARRQPGRATTTPEAAGARRWRVTVPPPFGFRRDRPGTCPSRRPAAAAASSDSPAAGPRRSGRGTAARHHGSPGCRPSSSTPSRRRTPTPAPYEPGRSDVVGPPTRRSPGPGERAGVQRRGDCRGRLRRQVACQHGSRARPGQPDGAGQPDHPALTTITRDTTSLLRT